MVHAGTRKDGSVRWVWMEIDSKTGEKVRKHRMPNRIWRYINR